MYSSPLERGCENFQSDQTPSILIDGQCWYDCSRRWEGQAGKIAGPEATVIQEGGTAHPTSPRPDRQSGLKRHFECGHDETRWMREPKEREICGWKQCLDGECQGDRGRRKKEGRVFADQGSSEARDVADEIG
jgi:hypothetical protein